VLTRVSRRSKTVGAKGFGRTGRKPAPVLVPDRLTVKMTVNFGGAASGALQINSLERSLMIEWE
jgi:acyl dehydratase